MAVAQATQRLNPPAARQRVDPLPYLLLLPSLVAFAVLLLYPIAQAVALSFRYYVLTRPERGTPFVGLANYADALGRPEVWQSLGRAAVYTAGTVGSSVLIGLVTALALHQRFWGRAFFRAALIVPWVVPQVVTALIWVWMLDRQFGIINYLLLGFGPAREPIGWLTDTAWAMPSVIAVGSWKEYPVATLMLLAGLQNIPSEYYEAAAIDGANAWRRFRDITLPGLAPVAGILVLLQVIWSFKSFAYVYLMTQGGPARTTETVVVHVYLQAFRNFNFGLASAIGVLMIVILSVFSVLYMWALRSWGSDH